MIVVVIIYIEITKKRFLSMPRDKCFSYLQIYRNTAHFIVQKLSLICFGSDINKPRGHCAFCLLSLLSFYSQLRATRVKSLLHTINSLQFNFINLFIRKCFVVIKIMQICIDITFSSSVSNVLRTLDSSSSNSSVVADTRTFKHIFETIMGIDPFSRILNVFFRVSKLVYSYCE